MNAPCMHPDFAVFVDVHRMFGEELTEAEALARPPDSVSLNVRGECSVCGTTIRFEGPIGVSVGAGAPPMVSMDGTELRANGHLGENRTPGIVARLTIGPAS